MEHLALLQELNVSCVYFVKLWPQIFMHRTCYAHSVSLAFWAYLRACSNFVSYMSLHVACCSLLDTRFERRLEGRLPQTRKEQEKKIPALEQCIMTK